MLQKIREIKRKLTSRNSLNNSYLNELVSSIHRADIKATVFSIFWAAGPVTIIAISLGYYLSHGVRVPIETVLYFSFYVFFVGLVGFVSKLVFDSIQYRKKEAIQEKFLTVIDESYNNLFLSKKLNLANLTDDVKNNKIAYDILCKSHPTSKEIFYAFDLHFDTEIAEFVQIIHLYKENGFPIDSQANRQKLIKYYKKIDIKVDIPDILKMKFLEALKGDYASIKKGVERKLGFLSKIYNSSGQHGLFDLDDAYHAIAFFIELLSGRKIYYYKAISKFDDVKKDYLFKSIESLRDKIIQKYNHIQGVHKQLFLTVSEMLPNLELCEVLNISEDISYNLSLLDESLKEIRVRSLDRSVKKQFQLSRYRFHQNLRIINTLLKRLDLLLKQWHSLSFDKTEQINNHNVKYELAYVQLEEKSRMSIAYDMATYLNYNNEFESSDDMIKSFAHQVVKIIQEPISLDQPSILTAIELSSGANLSSVQLNNSTKQKLDSTYNLCKSVKTDIKEIRQRVKKVVIAQYA
ncbi:hypothetical protein [Francisella adeliensis]|uniref:Uncharacterized protein n=1 Tax=Francisella adeliensis TaxID=2007306 RepID=A0A2Z4XZB9_9GAMM|nr:hypothetical protein [Francisella adeliensis]AXA34129.1 hypothetical protein CDH04_06770 [Francisella adeliensis]MBK2085297.1 hypothetical protein [Francisella adeliensis]MBK2095935.1 hypothetical protein [Francisella adeliensis]QIW12371.1 hypothetical protein FZC43_06770 [Francisella adeliensis]QIW14245.1 hypothetical protein FZC44_06770 [Francisella adeliensis]